MAEGDQHPADVKDGSRYFGPYTSAGAAYKTINLLNRLFPYRKCDKKITGHDDVCLYYHMHQCTAPCISAVDRDTYMRAINGATMFLSGRGEEIVGASRRRWSRRPRHGNFERAAELRDRLSAITHVLERQKIVSARGTNADIIGLAHGAGGDAGVQVGFLRNGKIIGSEFFPMQAAVNDTAGEILSSFVTQFYAEAAVIPARLMLQHSLPEAEREIIGEWLIRNVAASGGDGTPARHESWPGGDGGQVGR
jgi:excinuclease ABC subunit C